MLRSEKGESVMASYSVKLVNRTRATSRLLGAIQTNLQGFFNEVFQGTSDSATVQWGTGVAADAVVVHFVADKDSSYLKQIRPNEGGQRHAGGHTSYGQPMGSEIYQHIVEPDGKRHMDTDAGYAKLAFHEILHNQFPGRSGAEIHGAFGGGGFANAVVLGEHPNDRNKEIMRQGLSVKTAQIL